MTLINIGFAPAAVLIKESTVQESHCGNFFVKSFTESHPVVTYFVPLHLVIVLKLSTTVLSPVTYRS